MPLNNDTKTSKGNTVDHIEHPTSIEYIKCTYLSII